MKIFFTLLLILCITSARTQVVNIPDSNFRRALIIAGVDANNDGLIQQSEALNTTDITFLGYLDTLPRVIHNVTGLRAFTNLAAFNFKTSYFNAVSIDLSGMQSLAYLYLENGGLMPVPTLTGLNITGCANIVSLIVRFNQHLGRIDISSCPNLVSFESLFNGNLEVLLGVHRRMVNFYFEGSTTGRLDLTACDSLVNLSLNSSEANHLDMSGLRFVQSLSSTYMRIDTLNASNCSNLSSVQITNLGQANFTDCINLQHLSIGNGSASFYDFSTCSNLRDFELRSGNFKYLNLKNGRDLDYFTIGTSQDSLYVCADAFEIDTLSTYFQLQGIETLVTDNCTFFPGSPSNSISGNLWLNPAGSACDSTNTGMGSVAIRISDGVNNMTRFTMSDGLYVHYADSGNFTLTPYFPYPYFAVNPLSATVQFDTANNLTAVRNFCITPVGIHNDLEVWMVPVGVARPGFPAYYQLKYRNRGTTTLSGFVNLSYSNANMSFTSASIAPATQTAGNLSWNYTNLSSFQERSIDLQFLLSPPPTNNFGDTLFYMASITPVANDETPFDNEFILPQLVQGAYDPNDKTCLQGNAIDTSRKGDYLHYMIRFQNTGNDTAFNIVIRDTISSKFDLASFQMLGSSHVCNAELEGNLASFHFENILLPDSNVNEPASHGYVLFKIKPKANVALNDSLNNKAGIYFDFNPPVITNTATTVVSALAPQTAISTLTVTAANGNHILKWNGLCNNAVFYILERSSNGFNYESIGSKTVSAQNCMQEFSFEDENPVQGRNYYRVKIVYKNGKTGFSNVVSIGESAGITAAITAVVNNTAYVSSLLAQEVNVQIIATDGKVLYSTKRSIPAGSSTIALPTFYTHGLYLFVLQTNEGRVVRKFIY